MKICFDISNIKSKGAVIIAPIIINYLLTLYPASQIHLLIHPTSKIDFSKIHFIKNSQSHKSRSSETLFNNQQVNAPNQSSGSYKTLSGNRYLRFLWMFIFSGRYLRQNDCEHLISLGGYYLGSFRPFSIVIQNLLPFDYEVLKMYLNLHPSLRINPPVPLRDKDIPLGFSKTNFNSTTSSLSFRLYNSLRLNINKQPSRFTYFFIYLKMVLLRDFHYFSAQHAEKIFYFTEKSRTAIDPHGKLSPKLHQLNIDPVITSPEPTWRNELYQPNLNPKKLDNIIHTSPPTSKTSVPLPNSLNLLYVAEFLPYKNHSCLYTAVNTLLSSDYNITLTLIGGNPDYKNPISQIRFLGSLSHEQVLNEYPNYDCLVYPSFVESLGIPIYEALSARLPIICSNTIDFLPDTNMKNIHLFNPHNPDELIKMIKVLYAEKFAPIPI